MKIKSYTLLFRFFSFLADKTNGAPLFVKYKLLLGTLILGISTSVTNAQTINKEKSDSISKKPEPAQIKCYETAAINNFEKITVKGKVVDESGEGISRVTIKIKNSKGVKLNETLTDIDGKFNITVLDTDTLTFSYVGYKTVSLQASKITNNQHVALNQKSIELKETVITKRHTTTCYAVTTEKATTCYAVTLAPLKKKKRINIQRMIHNQPFIHKR